MNKNQTLELIAALKEASRVIQRLAKDYREPLPDELTGFAYLLEDELSQGSDEEGFWERMGWDLKHGPTSDQWAEWLIANNEAQ